MNQIGVQESHTQTNQQRLVCPISGQGTSQFPNVTRKDLSQCQWCYKSRQEPGVILSNCGGCKRAWYCSKECQKAAWPIHKIACRINVENSKQHPDAQDVMKKLSTFCARHRPSLLKYRIQALDLANNPDRRLRNILAIDVIPVVDEEGNLKSSRLFLAFEARIESVDGFLPEQRHELKLQMKLFDEDSRRSGNMGGFFVIVIDCPSGAGNVCPMGFPKEIVNWERAQPWKEPLLNSLNAPLKRLEGKQGFGVGWEVVPMPD